MRKTWNIFPTIDAALDGALSDSPTRKDLYLTKGVNFINVRLPSLENWAQMTT